MDTVFVSTIPVYPKIYALGHPALKSLLLDPVVIQEKIDGSQFSFGVYEGELMVRSKGKQMILDAPEKLFSKAVDYVKILFQAGRLREKLIYRCEFLRSPKHNTLSYTRAPKNHLVLFDVYDLLDEQYYGHERLEQIADELEIDCVPQFMKRLLSMEEFSELLERESFLGGQKIEGIVIKNYSRFCEKTGYTLMGKYVSEAFKEVHEKEWRQENPSSKDIATLLGEEYKTPARWEKAVFRLRDEGGLENSPKDIGKLMKMVWPDIVAECEKEIKEKLWKHFSKDLARKVVSGLPEWYKLRLAEKQFDNSEE